MPDRTPGSRRRMWAIAALCVVAAPLLGVVLEHGGSAQARGAAAPSFTRDVAPIVREKCAGCHRIGGIAPFAFRSAHDVSSKATLIADAVRAGRMPPWPPGPKSARFQAQDQHVLTARERDTLVRWALTGARVDGSKVGAPPASDTRARAGETMLRLGLTSAYTPRAVGGATDDYRCFLLDPGLTQDSFVTSARVEPGETALVHHVILFRVPGAAVAEAQALDREDPGAGWTCFGGTGISLGGGGPRVLDDAPWIAAWAPGFGGNRVPPGVGIPLPAGSRVVMQVHYNLLNGRRPDRSRAVLTTVPASSGLTPLATVLLPAPVELACAKGETGRLCDRTEALFALVKKYGGEAGLIPSGLLLYCGKNASAPRAGQVTSCQNRFDGPATVYSVAGHMHLLGRSIRVELNPGKPDARILLDIPRWDFHWQAAYTLAEPVRVNTGDTLRVTCRHDASLRRRAQQAAARTPRYILWGEGTTDEMCLGIVQVTRG